MHIVFSLFLKNDMKFQSNISDYFFSNFFLGEGLTDFPVTATQKCNLRDFFFGQVHQAVWVLCMWVGMGVDRWMGVYVGTHTHIHTHTYIGTRVGVWVFRWMSTRTYIHRWMGVCVGV